MAQFSSANRITPEIIRQSKKGLCRGAYGTQDDMQCLGYDHLCALAAVLYPPDGDSYEAVRLACEECDNSRYSKGFQHGWDDKVKSKEDADAEYELGYSDGVKCASSFPWESNRPNDGYYR
jgi:hypothetical protein